MSESATRPSTPSLLAEAMAQMTKLLETEIRLVRTELSEKVSEVIRAIALIVFSAVLLLVAVGLLLQGVVYVLVYYGMQPFAAYFTIAALAIVVGGLAVLFAVRQLRPSELTPKHSVSQLGKDAHFIKEQV